MSFSRRFLFCVAACLSVFAAAAQDFFQKTYDFQQERSYGLVVLPGDHVALAGSTQDPNATAGYLLIQRLNEHGELLWAKSYPALGVAVSPALLRMNDGNLLVCWHSVNNKSGWMKVAPDDGQVIWTKYITGGTTLFSNVTALSDGNYLLTGYHAASNGNDFDAFAVKIDSNGERLWSNYFDSGDIDELHGCYEDPTGILYCSGSSSVNGFDGWLAKLGPNGALVGPVRRYGTSLVDNLLFVTNTTQDRLLLAGYSNGFAGHLQLWLLEVDGAGLVRWSKTYDYDGESTGASDLLHLPGDQFMLAVNDPFPGALGNAAIFLKLDLSGDIVVLANRYHTDGEDEVLGSIGRTSTGFAAAGWAWRNGNQDCLLVKTDTNGNIPGCCPEPISFTIANVTPQTNTFVPTQHTSLGVTDLPNVQAVDVASQTRDLCQLVDTDFDLSADTVCPGECVEITLPDPTPGATYQFAISGGEPDPVQTGRICYPLAGVFTLTRVGQLGPCPPQSTTKSVLVTAVGDRQTPTAFSPDGDGTNERFKLIFDCPPETFLIRVYDRWGEIVYESLNANEGWDGMVNGNPAPTDVYIWQATFDGQTAEGGVTLLR